MKTKAREVKLRREIRKGLKLVDPSLFLLATFSRNCNEGERAGDAQSRGKLGLVDVRFWGGRVRGKGKAMT